MGKIEMQTDNLAYKAVFVELAWMLFIDCRENFAKFSANAREENNCLLACVFYFMIRYSLEYICPRNLLDSIYINKDKKFLIARILDFLLNTFQIEDIGLYK